MRFPTLTARYHLESLSGIETKGYPFVGCVFLDLDITLNPYQGLKPTALFWAVLADLDITLNPYQGLKLGVPPGVGVGGSLDITLNPYQGLKLKR